MIHTNDIIRMFESNRRVIQMQIAGISDEQSLIQPPNGGNCLRWVLGHLADNLRTMLTLLGGEVPAKLERLSRFGYSSAPVLAAEAGLLSMAEIMQAYDDLHAMLIERLEQTPEADYEKMVTLLGEEQRLGWRVYFLGFHHHYHIGQLEYLRNLAGFTEPLI